MSEKERKIFGEYNQNSIPIRWERMKWVKDLERKYNVEHRRMWPHIVNLYGNSTRSYIYETYLASILAISSAIESFLESKIPEDLKTKLLLSLSDLINYAKQLGIISDPLERELSDFTRYIRDHLVYPKGPFALEMLGFKKEKDKRRWISPTGELVQPYTPKEAAEHGIDLFLRTIKEVLHY